MLKVTLVGPRRLLVAVLDLLHSQGNVHLDPFPIPAQHRVSGAILPTPERAENRDLAARLLALRDRVARLRSVLPQSPAASPISPSSLPLWLLSPSVSAEDLTESLAKAEEEIAPVAEAQRRLREETANLSRYQKVLAALYPLLQEVTEGGRMELLGVVLERRRGDIIPLLQKELARITEGRFQLFTGAMDRDQIAAIIAYPPPLEGVVRDLFSQEDIAEIRLPETYADLPLSSTLRRIIRRTKELPALVTARESELAVLARRWSVILSRMEELLLDRLDEIRTITMSAQGERAFFLRGWVPRDQASALRAAVAGNFGGEVLLETSVVLLREHDGVPVDLRNRPFARFFEPLVRLISLPRYGTVDPTPFMAHFFPLFFGFMLGDIGYGAILLALAAWVRRRSDSGSFRRNIAGVFLLSGLSAVIFGILFGEVFGNLGEHYGLHPLLADRAKAFMPLLYASVGLGYLHVTLGFLLSLLAGIRGGGWRHRAGATGNLLVMGGLVLALLGTTGLLPAALAGGGLWAAGAGVLLVVAGEGPMGVLELLKTFGNVLSYARLMAIGMSSVILAKVANEMGGAAGNILLGIAAALLFHALNFALGVFSPAIHSLRLHYVEFFGKFYKPGGRPYQPFRRHEVA